MDQRIVPSILPTLRKAPIAGSGQSTAESVLMVPFTFGMDPVVAVALLVSVYMAGEYGGSITAIAIGTPGTPAAAAAREASAAA